MFILPEVVYISRSKSPFRPASVDSSLPVTCYLLVWRCTGVCMDGHLDTSQMGGGSYSDKRYSDSSYSDMRYSDNYRPIMHTVHRESRRLFEHFKPRSPWRKWSVQSQIVLCDVLNVTFLSRHSCLAAARQSRSHSFTVRPRLVLLLCCQSLQFLETNIS